MKKLLNKRRIKDIFLKKKNFKFYFFTVKQLFQFVQFRFYEV